MYIHPPPQSFFFPTRLWSSPSLLVSAFRVSSRSSALLPSSPWVSSFLLLCYSFACPRARYACIHVPLSALPRIERHRYTRTSWERSRALMSGMKNQSVRFEESSAFFPRSNPTPRGARVSPSGPVSVPTCTHTYPLCICLCMAECICCRTRLRCWA